MRILQVHNYYQIPGGEDQVVKNENNLLKKHGHSVWLYQRSNDDIKDMSLIKRLTLPVTTCFSLRTYQEVKRFIKEKHIDVLHVHNTLPLISPSVFYAAFATHIPVVLTVHNYRLFCPAGTCYRNRHICEACVQKGLWQSIRYKCYRDSRIQTMVLAASIKLHRILGTYKRISYICLTEFHKEKLLKVKQIAPDQIFVKPNYTEQVKEVVPSDKRGNYIVYAGRLEENKGIKVVLCAYKKLQKNCTKEELEKVPALVVCGDGSLKRACENYVKKHKLTKVTFKGMVPNDEVKALMGQGKAVIVPSLLYEGFPMNVAEAYALRTPIIGSNIGNVGNLITDGKNGWKFKTGDVCDLAMKIKNCNPMECDFALEDAKAWEEENNYKRLIEIYERCISHVRNKEK